MDFLINIKSKKWIQRMLNFEARANIVCVSALSSCGVGKKEDRRSLIVSGLFLSKIVSLRSNYNITPALTVPLGDCLKGIR